MVISSFVVQNQPGLNPCKNNDLIKTECRLIDDKIRNQQESNAINTSTIQNKIGLNDD